MKPIAKLLLGGIEDGEYGEVDIETSHREIEAMQERLVTSGDDVWVSLYALDVDALRGELLDVLQFESHRMGAVSEGILRRAIARMDDVSPNAQLNATGVSRVAVEAPVGRKET